MAEVSLENVKPNSHTYKESQRKENKKINKVVTGKVTKKAKRHSFSELFLSEEIGDVKEYLIYDLLIPAIKDMFVTTMQNSIDMLFYGRVRGRKSKSSVSYFDYTSPSRRSEPRSSRSVYRFDDIFLETKGEAEQVLDVLQDAIDQYGSVTVGDYYDAVGVTGNGWTDRSYGWTDLRQAWVSRERNGYTINMPKVEEIR